MGCALAPQAILRKHIGDTSQHSTQRTRQRILEEACTPNRYDSRTQARTATTRRNKAQASVQEVHFRPEVLPTSAFWHTVQARNKKSNYDCLMQPRTHTAHHGRAQGLLAHLKGMRCLLGALTMVLRSEACCHRTRGKVIPRRPAPVEPTSATIKSTTRRPRKSIQKSQRTRQHGRSPPSAGQQHGLGHTVISRRTANPGMTAPFAYGRFNAKDEARTASGSSRTGSRRNKPRR